MRNLRWRACRGRNWPRTLLFALLLLLLAGPRRATAQFNQSVPSANYFSAFAEYWDGDYRDALRNFQSEARAGGIRAGTNRWIDSICAYTMVGECNYQLGLHQAALADYTSALQLFFAYNNWMMRVQFPPGIRAATPGQFRPIPWGRSTRPFVLGNYPDTFPIMQGNFTVAPLAQGQQQQTAVLGTPIAYSIDVQEIVRCTCLAMRRRRELMGPACAQDSLTNDLITALARRPGVPNHWSECWIDLQLGLAYLCGGKDLQAKASLERAVLAAGQFDHPLTGIALLELGRLALAASDYNTAANYFAEASYTAGAYMDPIVVEEAIRYGHLTHLLSNQQGVFPPLAQVTLWAKANNLRQLNVTAQILAAENYCVLNQPTQAANLVTTATASMGRRAMALGKAGARVNLVAAQTAYLQSHVDVGDKALAAAINFQKNGSVRLFHIALADSLYKASTVTPRVAMELYNEVLRDPLPIDWATDPLEALSLMVVPHQESYENWLEVAIDRKDHERVLEISDLARRHKFLSTLEMGGRLHNLRWLLEGPEENLDQEGKLERQDLLARYPDYVELRKEAQKLRDELLGKSLALEDAHDRKSQSNQFAKLAEIGAQQEVLLRLMAVRREPAVLVFPPFRRTKEIKEGLPPGHAILSFFATPRQAYALLITRDKYGYWKVPNDEQLAKPVMKLLQGLGSAEANREVTLKDLTAESWREPAKQILEALTKDSRADLKSFKELIIVPEGILWYVPFEALPVKDGDDVVPLMTKLQIRYAPLVSLGVGDPRPRKTGGQTAIIVGRLKQGGDGSHAEAAYEEIAKVVPGATALRPPLPHDAATLATLCDSLIVLNDIPTSDDSPYDWSPLPQDQAGNGALANWFALPWGGPETVIMPSFHTAAERAMKKQTTEPGSEVFFSVCGLMANGARTILLSRWRTGGQTSVDLVREFVQELPHTPAAEAWQRSLLLVADSQLNAEAEPRLRLTAHEEAPKAEHPFFWAGQLLIDTGALPQELFDQRAKEMPPAAAKLDGEKPVNINAAGTPAAGGLPAAGGAVRMAPGAQLPGAAQLPAAGAGGLGAGGGAAGGLGGGRPAAAGQQPAGGFAQPGGFGQPGGGLPAAGGGAMPPRGNLGGAAPQNFPGAAGGAAGGLPGAAGNAGLDEAQMIGGGAAPETSGKSSKRKPPKKPTKGKGKNSAAPVEGVTPTDLFGSDPSAGPADDGSAKRPRGKTSSSKSSSSKSSTAKGAAAKKPPPVEMDEPTDDSSQPPLFPPSKGP